MAIVSTCVSPRVKRPEPCVRGRRPTSRLIGADLIRLRPSGRTPSFEDPRRGPAFFMCSSSAALRSAFSWVARQALEELLLGGTCVMASPRSSFAAATRSQLRVLAKSMTSFLHLVGRAPSR